ncbi:MAG: decaprenylphospho-beta-D-erythro-pentofuranosid-2-ulose 2-reductase [Frankiaceae bacterium]|nr:decaprenylphospho-beta-D-erythro-pentofuranosid-2-ulose 2-reductase [Frankiaceae bacterium]
MNDALGGVQTVLVLGGTSELAQATLAAMDLRPGARVVLAGRDASALRAVSVPGATVTTLEWDAADSASGPALIDLAVAELGDIDVVLAAAGILGQQDRAEVDYAHAASILQVNLVGLAATLLPAAAALKRQGHGVLVVFSSVAGLRGRRSNFVYGASKAGLDALSEGLQASLVGTGVRLVLVRPGFVRSKMTAGMEDAPFATTPDVVGKAVAKAIRRGSAVVHVPRVLGPVFVAMRSLPRGVFRRLPG